MDNEVDVVSDPALRTVTGHAGPAPGHGPYLTVHLTLAGDRVQAATFETYQCPGCHACGKAAVELVTGRSLSECRAITYQTIVDRVGPLPKHRRHCYALAILSLSKALDAAVAN